MATEKIDIDDGFAIHTYTGATTYTGTTIRGGKNIETYTVAIPELGLDGLDGEWDNDARHNVQVPYTPRVRRAMRRAMRRRLAH